MGKKPLRSLIDNSFDTGLLFEI